MPYPGVIGERMSLSPLSAHVLLRKVLMRTQGKLGLREQVLLFHTFLFGKSCQVHQAEGCLEVSFSLCGFRFWLQLHTYRV